VDSVSLHPEKTKTTTANNGERQSTIAVSKLVMEGMLPSNPTCGSPYLLTSILLKMIGCIKTARKTELFILSVSTVSMGTLFSVWRLNYVYMRLFKNFPGIKNVFSIDKGKAIPVTGHEGP
jgi:hypothetical protein